MSVSLYYQAFEHKKIGYFTRFWGFAEGKFSENPLYVKIKEIGRLVLPLKAVLL
jgi:hypothetical protein